ncbi:hypothetical protein M1P56_32550 [Streptomyces sp. HU2014]|uniref:hypothetical protein n=1 Tax=Streptomyces sp. HU2014 TaxID=2939414 RepID=UPI00200E4C2A|nr:hypothetical protein [Streptomyces sp. HU2014]UQI48710.1 hypothetical protein M1P56_32550 [Streptomyces sp. HU2014]
MNIPLWFAVVIIGYLGVKLTHVPRWMVFVLLIGGFLLADSFLGGPIESGINGGASIIGGSK